MKPATFLVLIAGSLAGCAAMQAGETRTTEQLLAAAGFQMKAADTPEKRARLQTLTPRQILSRPRGGEPRYVYVDPTGCQCLYAGNEQQYQEFRRLRLQRQIEHENDSDSDNVLMTGQYENYADENFWAPWP